MVTLSLGLTLSSGLAATANADPSTARTSATSAAVGTASHQAAKPKKKRHGNPTAKASRALRGAVKPKAVLRHLTALQRIANRNDGNRASGTDGFGASKDYIVAKLRKAGYRPSVQKFTFDYFSETAPAVLSRVQPSAKNYTNPDDFSTMSYSGSGDVTAPVVAVDTDVTPSDASTSGCEASDFSAFPSGSIALIQRGTCDFLVKAKNAEAAGAAGVIIFNRGTTGEDGPLAGTLAETVGLPVVGTNFAVGQELNASGTTVHLTTATLAESRTTFNVTAQTKRGKRGKVVMAGAHLDSVEEGPGINDNGSGSAALLAIAEKMKKVKNRNAVRFAWWGAEEAGLLGAEHYVADLADNNPKALRDIRLYLNFDMIGSRNYVRFVYDGDNSAFGEEDGAADAPRGSGLIERTFASFFKSKRQASRPTAFDGRSDYGPFIDQGIASGGLFSGAEGVKTKGQAKAFGGKAGQPYDACYHQACDNLGNVSKRALREFVPAIAHSIAKYSVTVKGIPRSKAPASARSSRALPRAAHGHLMR